MKIAIMAGLSAERDMNVNTSHQKDNVRWKMSGGKWKIQITSSISHLPFSIKSIFTY
jgi:hypothetical protein